MEIGPDAHQVLATIVEEADDRDAEAILDPWRRALREVCQVWHARSDAIANAAEEDKSIYGYVPPRARRASAKAFLENADAVGGALTRAALPHLPPRGCADAFASQHWS